MPRMFTNPNPNPNPNPDLYPDPTPTPSPTPDPTPNASPNPNAGLAFLGRSEEKLMHVFRTLGRIAMMPGAGAGGDGTGLVPVTEGAHFRKEHSDMVLLG